MSMHAPPVSIESKVAALRLNAAYPGHPGAVEVIETHMSWVFLTEQYVYKLKKPVRYDGLDFSTLEAREFYCREELRLNRRLAAAVYLDVVALRMDRDGALRIRPSGDVVDWLVWMRRLPAHFMLDWLLKTGKASASHLSEVARRMAHFYSGLPAAVTDPAAYVSRLRRQIDAFEYDLCEADFALPAGEVANVCAQLRHFLHGRVALFEARVSAGHIVEGHGDLRPEHIYLGTPPAIIDCLEFSAELRTLDTADELSFLALECERLSSAQLGRVLIETYSALSGDAPDAALLDFYKGFRACIRARIAIDHLKEPQYRDSPKWPQRARRYLQLATRHTHSMGPDGGAAASRPAVG